MHDIVEQIQDKQLAKDKLHPQPPPPPKKSTIPKIKNLITLLGSKSLKQLANREHKFV